MYSLSIDRSYFGNNCAFQGGVLNSFLNSSIEIRDSEFVTTRPYQIKTHLIQLEELFA